VSKLDTVEQIGAMLGVVPFKPPAQFDPQVTVQPEFQHDSDEQFVQDWLVSHKSPWRLARINGEMHYMLVYENANPAHMEIWGY
jgi:hypothetical protein